ncbi:MAG: rod shape-determining protein MreC [Candidatus Omnitrophica bacterium]|nr:rod shape-determining protein MreC [Candidatus Omnitrophota bacterium]
MLKLNRKSIIAATLLLAFLFLISVLIPTLRKPVLNVFNLPMAVFSFFRQELGGLIFFHSNLVQAQKLKSKVDLLRKQLNDRNELYLENTRLRSLLSFKETIPYKVIAARVIGRDPSNWSSAIIIDKGSSNGIKNGFVSVTFYGLVGRVIETSATASKIMLLNDSNLNVSAIVQRSRQEGLVCGSLGGSLIMKYLPKDSDIRKSDIILTSGLTNIYPKGLAVGMVVDIGQEFSSLTNYAIIRPAVDFSALEEVLVIIP